MVYGRGTKRTRTSVYGRSTRSRVNVSRRRSRRLKATGRTKARAAPRRTIANNYRRTRLNTRTAGLALKLARRAINSSYGPVQKQLQHVSAVLKPVMDHPIAFDMNDFCAGDHKFCQFFSPYNNGTWQILSQHFRKNASPADDEFNMWLRTEGYEVNAPQHKALYAVYEFDIDAKVDDVYLRFDFITPTKKNMYAQGNATMMPAALCGLTRLANCPMENKINKEYFKAWRKPIIMYFNSRGTYQNTSAAAALGDMLGQAAPAVGHDGHEFTREFPSTTPFRKRFKIYHKVNRVIKEKKTSMLGQDNHVDSTIDTNVNSASVNTVVDHVHTTGQPLSYSSFFNKDPFDLKWCVMSCSDSNSNPILSDSVEINISRYVVWRDEI